jgi:hypothetical protein
MTDTDMVFNIAPRTDTDIVTNVVLFAYQHAVAGSKVLADLVSGVNDRVGADAGPWSDLG